MFRGRPLSGEAIRRIVAAARGRGGPPIWLAAHRLAARRRSVVALLPIEQFPHGIQMTGVPGGLLHHVNDHPPQGCRGGVEVGVLAHLIQRMSAMIS